MTGMGCGDDPPPPAPTVALVETIRGAVHVVREEHGVDVIDEARVEEGASVETAADGRASLRLDTGAWVLLDRSTRVVVTPETLHIEEGRIFIDGARVEGTRIESEDGAVTGNAATFAVARAAGGTTDVYCAAGEISYRTGGDEGDDTGILAQGELLHLRDGGAEKEPAAMWDDWTGGLADPAPRAAQGPTHIGLLAGRGLYERGVARTALPIRSHDVRATVRGDLATTEVIQTFFNARSDTLEAEYVIRLPEGAIVQGFAVDLGSGFVDGAVAPIATTGGYEIAFADSGSSGSHLTFDGPDRLRARVHPVEPGATVRVKLSYSEWLERRGNMRTYLYPMRSDAEPPLIGELSLEIDGSGAMASAYRAGMGARVENGRVTLRKSDFHPSADFYLDLIDADEVNEDLIRAYVVSSPASADEAERPEGEERYVLFDVPSAKLVDVDADDAAEPPLELVVLLDVSGATDGEDLELGRSVVEAVLRQLAPGDRVAVRLADVGAHVPEGAPDGLVAVDDASRERWLDVTARAQVGGATDLAESLRQAATLVAGKPRGAVLYLGDGLPTTGAMDATSIKQVLAGIDAPPRFFALGIGDGANLDLLESVFGANVVGVSDRRGAIRKVMGVLAQAARPTLRGIQLDLGEDVERVYPRAPITLGDGLHLRLLGRLKGNLPTAITVRGQRDGVAFERELTVGLMQVDDRGDIRRRWAQARLMELLDEDAGREALVELGVRFNLLTPWTSFVVGGIPGGAFVPIEGFDHDPVEVAWGVGGGGVALSVGGLGGSGWRRRARSSGVEPNALVEETWVRRVPSDDQQEVAAVGPIGDGGLTRAAVSRAVQSGERGPRACYERKLIVRPDLAGDVQIEVGVDGRGSVQAARIVSSTLGVPDVDQCILTELRGIRFPATGATTVTTVTHTYSFLMSDGEIRGRRQCSDASRQSLETRRVLWRERLAANAGVRGAVSVYREAAAQCELGGFRERRTLLDMMLRHVGGVSSQVELYRAFGSGSAVSGYLRRAILRNVRTPQDVLAVRAGLGLDVPVDWDVFARLWRANRDNEARLRLVRSWLEVVPDEMDLRLRLLSLLEQTGKIPEAKRQARELRAEALADARVRTAVGEFWLRQDNEVEARRVFSELVELAPLDPWARKRLGDLYRAHGWSDDAYREYGTLARLRPDHRGILLDLARAAAGAGRIDEALRLEQRLSESTDVDSDEGEAAFARLWTLFRLSHLKLGVDADDREAIARRERDTGALRDPPALLAILAWEHPDDRPMLFVRRPGSAEQAAGDTELEWERAALSGPSYGIEAIRDVEREEGEYVLEVRREEDDEIRDVAGELLVILGLGTEDERILRTEITLNRTESRKRFAMVDDARLEPRPVPPRP